MGPKLSTPKPNDGKNPNGNSAESKQKFMKSLQLFIEKIQP